jgi:hypothetical protein
MLTKDQEITFRQQLSRDVWVRAVELDEVHDDCTVVTLHADTPAEVIVKLPDHFERDPVRYQIEQAAPQCGEPGHQCSCDTGPK